jgi:hypothetical protein
LGEQIGNGLGGDAVERGERIDLLLVDRSLRPQLPQPCLAAFRDRRLSNEPPEDQLPGRVQPVIRQRIDHVAPDPSLDRIKTSGRRWTTVTGDKGGDLRGSRATSHLGISWAHEMNSFLGLLSYNNLLKMQGENLCTLAKFRRRRASGIGSSIF